MHEIQSKEVMKKLLGPLERHGFIPKKNRIADCACLMRIFSKLGYNCCIVKPQKAIEERVW